MLQSLLVYGFMMSSMYILGELSCYSKSGKKLFFVSLSVIIFSFFSGIRYDVGVDYISYLTDFKRILLYSDNEYAFNSYFDRFEKGYLMISSLFLRIGFGYPFLFGLYAFIQISCIYCVYKKDCFIYPFIGFCLIAVGGYFMWMNAIRQIVAFSFFVMAIKFAIERKIFCYLLFGVLAWSMHKSAIVLILFYPIIHLCDHKLPTVRFQILIFLLSYLLSQFHIFSYLSGFVEWALSFMGDFGERYAKEDLLVNANKDLRFGLRALILLILNFIVIINSHKLAVNINSKLFYITYNFFFWGIIFQQLFINNHHFTRFTTYFSSFDFLVYSYLLAYSFKNGATDKERALGIGIIFLSLVYLVTALYGDGGTASLLYKFYEL